MNVVILTFSRLFQASGSKACTGFGYKTEPEANINQQSVSHFTTGQ